MDLGGKIRYRTGGANQFVVEWVAVPEFGTSASNQNSDIVTMSADGTIEFKYERCDLQDALVGISPGGGSGGGFDLSHGYRTYSGRIYELFTGGSAGFDLGIANVYRNKLRFRRLGGPTGLNYAVSFERY